MSKSVPFKLRHPSGRPGNDGRGGRARSAAGRVCQGRARRGPWVTGPGNAPRGAGGKEGGESPVTAAPPRSYLGGDALPAGCRRPLSCRRLARLMGSAPLPRRRAGCLSEGGPGHYPGAAAGTALRSGQSGRAGGGLCRRGRPSGL